MSEPKVLPSPRQTVLEQFDKFLRTINNLLVDDPNLKARDHGGVLTPALHVVNTPFTREFVVGPLKRKAEHLMSEADRLKVVAAEMAMTSSEMALLNSTVMDDETRSPAKLVGTYIELMRDLIKNELIDNPDFEPSVDADGNPVEAAHFSRYPMTESYIRDVLPAQAEAIKKVARNACGVCSVMAVSADEKLVLNRMIESLDQMTSSSPETEADLQYHSTPGM